VIPEGPLLEPKPRGKTDVLGKSDAGKALDGTGSPQAPAPSAPAAPVDDEAARACAVANEAAKGRKRLSPEDVAEFSQALDFEPEGTAATASPVALSAPAGAPHYLVTQVLGEPVELSPTQPCRVGRSEENEIVFPLSQVSRVHSEVRWDAQAAAYVVIDRNSINGTFVNGKPVKRRRLADGDRIGIGPFLIVYKVAAGSVKPRPTDETDVVRSGALAGELQEMPIGDVVRFIEALRKTGELALVGPGGERGTMFFRDGQPIHAEWKVQLGAQAAVAILRLKGGTFRFSAKTIDVLKATINAPLGALIAEAASPAPA
jgi:pSer/pThr/pTyr-binding forkhead associated (FHA) protein